MKDLHVLLPVHCTQVSHEKGCLQDAGSKALLSFMSETYLRIEAIQHSKGRMLQHVGRLLGQAVLSLSPLRLPVSVVVFVFVFVVVVVFVGCVVWM